MKCMHYDYGNTDRAGYATADVERDDAPNQAAIIPKRAIDRSRLRSTRGQVLVTGASGFIGSRLVDALLQTGYEVRCLVRASSNRAKLDATAVELVTGDVTDPESLSSAVAGVDAVFHLAGVTKALRRGEFERVNAQGTANLAEICARSSASPVLVLISSLAAAGPSPESHLRHESDPAMPVSNYGRSKRGGELAAARWAGEIPISIVRPPMVFGPGDRDFFNMVRPIARYGLHVVPGISRRRYSLVHADDLSAALCLVAQNGRRLPLDVSSSSDPGQGYYFVASSETPSYPELGELISRALGKPGVRIVRGPLALAWLAGAFGELGSQLRRRPGIINLDKAREASAGDWTCDASRSRAELGFAPQEDLLDRLRETAQWYIEQHWLPGSMAPAAGAH